MTFDVARTLWSRLRQAMTIPQQTGKGRDRESLAVGMILCAFFLDLAINVHEGEYDAVALFWLTIAAFVCFAAITLHLGPAVEEFLQRRFSVIVAVLAFICVCILLYQSRNDIEISLSVVVLAVLGVLQVSNLGSMRTPLFVVLVTGFCLVSVVNFTSPQRAKYPKIDVFLFQQSAADALRHGQDPYAIRFPNIYNGDNSRVFEDPHRYGPGVKVYGPGVVDDNGYITYGFPYTPLSLLMVMPAYVLGGDCRFAIVAAMGVSALLMFAARPGRRAALIALLFLVNPQGFFVINMSWTEPLLLLNFSLIMFCACRWRKGLPWALGLFFATKQYTVLAVPLLFLLVEGPNLFKELLKMVAKIALVVAVTNVPFFVWNPHEFIRAVVQWQLVQPFRRDALSYLVWLYNHNGGAKAPMWTPFLIVIPAIIFAIKRCSHTPAGFAAAIAFIYLIFFAFNKQAFCNYYYFVIGAACWSVAAMRSEFDRTSPAIGAAAIVAAVGGALSSFTLCRTLAPF